MTHYLTFHYITLQYFTHTLLYGKACAKPRLFLPSLQYFIVDSAIYRQSSGQHCSAASTQLDPLRSIVASSPALLHGLVVPEASALQLNFASHQLSSIVNTQLATS